MIQAGLIVQNLPKPERFCDFSFFRQIILKVCHSDAVSDCAKLRLMVDRSLGLRATEFLGHGRADIMKAFSWLSGWKNRASGLAATSTRKTRRRNTRPLACDVSLVRSNVELLEARVVLTAETASIDTVAFAKALTAAGVKFYGTAGSSDTTLQKQAFEDAGQFLPFVNVANADGTPNQTAIDNNITTFPTWVFPDLSRLTGVQTLDALSAQAGIAIPTGVAPSFSTIPNQPLQSGSPLLVSLDGYDPNGGLLTYTVAVTNNTAGVTAEVRSTQSAMKITVANYGEMVFQTFDDLAPRATEHIEALAVNNFYDGVTFHRVIDGFMIQGGDPTATGTGGSALGSFNDQFSTDLQFNRPGLLAMAKSLDDTNDSQFFITDSTVRTLDYQHTIFGVLVEGNAVRDAITSVITDTTDGNEATLATDKPLSAVTMTSVDAFTDIENGVIVLRAPEGRTGGADITVTVTDAFGNSYSQTFHVTVAADTANSNPFLSDIPLIRTLANTTLNFQLITQDADGSPANQPTVFFGQGTLSSNNLIVPYVTDTNKLNYSVNFNTGNVIVAPASNFVGTEKITVATASTLGVGSTVAQRSSTVDYQVVPIEVVGVASTLTLNANNDPAKHSANDGQADTFLVRVNNGLLEVTINGHVASLSHPNSVSTLIINGSDDADTLVVDYTNGSPIPSGGITFNGGTQPADTTDLLTMTGGAPSSVVYTMSNTTDGVIAINGASAIAFGATEAIRDDLAAVDRGFQLGSGNDSATLTDDATAANSRSLLTVGTGVQITFVNPTNSLAIGLGDGTDSFVATSLDSGFGSAVGLTFLGNGGDDTLNASAMTRAVSLSGGDGNDSLTGGTGADVFAVELGDDTLVGGDGNDTVAGVNLTGSLTLSDSQLVGLATDTVNSGLGSDQLVGIELANLAAGSLAVSINARAFTGSVTLLGGAGNDLLLGSSGADGISGGSGNDTLEGGQGNDTISGGLGTDLLQESGDVNFVLTNPQLTGLGTDSLNGLELAQLTGGIGANNINSATFNGTVTLNGGDGNDTLQAGNGNDSLSGEAGDDSLLGGAGNDTANGGDGNDIVQGNAGTDVLNGGAGDDRVDGGAGNSDRITGGLGSDTLNGGAGSSDVLVDGDNATAITLTNTTLVGLSTDSLLGFEGAQITGGAGHNTIDASAFGLGVTLSGGEGNDSLIGSTKGDVLVGNEGNDSLSGGAGNDSFDGGAGEDVVFEIVNNNVVVTNTKLTGGAGLGTDTLLNLENIRLSGGIADNKFDLTAFTGNSTLQGGAGADTLIGGSGNDRLLGQGGTGDVLTGNDGNDVLDGGTGDDKITESGNVDWLLSNTSLTGRGTDTVVGIELAWLIGGAADNQLNAAGFSGSTTLEGGSGNDTISGGSNADVLNGGVGNDSIVGNGGHDVIRGGTGNDILQGNDGNDSLIGGDGDDSIDGGAGNDGLSGNLGNDTLQGGTESDSLIGGDGNDVLRGGAGNDSMIGGLGNDNLDGEEGTDSMTGGRGNNAAPQALDTVTGAASEIINSLKFVAAWIDSV